MFLCIDYFKDIHDVLAKEIEFKVYVNSHDHFTDL